MLNLQISQQHVNPQALEVCRVLSAEGYQAFIVGGCVRDLLLGATPKDWDITTDASPQRVIEIFPKTIPTGLQHGTVTVVMGNGIENHFEVTTFRIEGEYKDGRRPEEVFFVMNVEQDLARRDLTINAIAYDPIANRMVDPYGGLADLECGVIRAVGNAEARFQEDGLRIMRVARFAARFGYAVDGLTFKGMEASLETLKKVSKERIQDELSKTLMSAHPSFGMQLLLNSGALETVVPLLKMVESLPAILHLDDCQGELETRLAFLFAGHDIERVEKELLALKFPNKEIKRVVFLLQLRQRYNDFIEKGTANSYKSFMALIKNHAPDSWEHTLEQFIQFTEAQRVPSRVQLSRFRGEVVFSKKEMVINGDDLLIIGMRPGPQIKKVLDICYLEILRNPENNTRSFLLDFAAGQ